MAPGSANRLFRAGGALGLCAALTLGASCGPSGEGPAATERVVDPAGLLSPEQRRSIADYLDFVQSDGGVDYRVVVADGVQGDLVHRGVSEFERLGVGSATAGRGVLLLVDVRAGRARVEVGYPLEDRVPDLEASSMIGEFLAPYFASGAVASGIEASVERLVELLAAGPEEVAGEALAEASGGAGATGPLLAGIDRLTPETRQRLQRILVPQARPEECVKLEIALMHRGIYYRDVPMYDPAWRRARRPEFPARRLKALAHEWDGPFAIERQGDHAIAYFSGQKGRRWGPQFLRRTEEGWIIDASLVARYIVYDYSNRFWYAVDGDYPYLALVRRVYDMRRVSLQERGGAWMIDSADPP